MNTLTFHDWTSTRFRCAFRNRPCMGFGGYARKRHAIKSHLLLTRKHYYTKPEKVKPVR